MSRYTKPQLEEFFYRQYEYIEALSEQLTLVREQNELLRAENKRLADRTQQSRPVPYKKMRRGKRDEKRAVLP